MSLKNAEKTSAGSGALLLLSSWSITRKLTVSYTLLTSMALSVVSGSLYWVLASNFERENNQFLADQIHVLRVVLKERPDSFDALRQEVEWEVTARRFEKYYARIIDEQGRVVIETPGLEEALERSLFPMPANETDAPGKGVKRKAKDGRPFLLTAALSEVGASGQKKYLHQVALDISYEEAILDNFSGNVVMMLLGGALFSVLAGIIVARKGLRPLEQITGAAQRITATQLHERIGPAPWPRELAALSAAFDEMLTRLEDSFTRLSQFSSDLAHELRTPINNLMGEAEVALSRERPSGEYRQVLESSLEECGRLARMIDGLLFLARAETKEKCISLSIIDARKEIESVREFYEAVANERGIQVTCQGNARMKADPNLFRRAISNLLSNSLQYTPRGGVITLLVENVDHQVIEVSVSDTGIGIGQEHLPKVFDRFYRVDSARSQYPQGTGLGLAIVKSIMELHRGTVGIASEPAKGTKVTLSFPV